MITNTEVNAFIINTAIIKICEVFVFNYSIDLCLNVNGYVSNYALVFMSAVLETELLLLLPISILHVRVNTFEKYTQLDELELHVSGL